MERSPDVKHYLDPHYRAQLPIEPTLLKVDAALDRFPGEQAHDNIAPILKHWSSSLVASTGDTSPFARVLSPGFRGMLLKPTRSQLLRPGPICEAYRRTYDEENFVPHEDFIRGLKDYFAGLGRTLVAEFQVTDIQPGQQSGVLGAGSSWRTRVRYEVVGTGHNFHREQRIGNWDLEWEAKEGEWRVAQWRSASDESLSRSEHPIFEDVTDHAFSSNPSYSTHLQHGVDYWRTVLDGACGIDVYGHNGVSAGDFDGDGLDDLYVCQPAGLPNRLFRNRGDGTFEDVTEASGLGILENTACALFADVNNNGHQDLIVVRSAGPVLYLNDGGGKFHVKADAFRFETVPQGTFTGAAIADYDRDGWLDIYFCLYLFYQGTEQYRYPSPYYDAQNGPPNFLMRNNRDGRFVDVTAKSGLSQDNTRYSFCCAWNDYNGDGWPDLYVVNDFGRKNLYRNNHDGTFTDVAALAGVEDVGAGMSVSCGDFNNDGREDLYVADMWTAAGLRLSRQDSFQPTASQAVKQQFQKHAMGNSLFRNTGDGTFRDVTSESGVGMGRWSWSSDAWDFDHDGFADLYITNGMVSGLSGDDLNSFFWRQVVANSPTEAAPAPAYEQGWNAINELLRADGSWSGYERNVVYANNRDGSLSNVSAVVGLDFGEDGRAFALADFDGDGRLEVLIKNRNAPQLRLLRNTRRDLPASVSFRLRGVKSNRDAIGAVVTIETDNGRQTRTVQAGSGFLSQHTKEMFFGLGQIKSPVHASVRWPSGLVQKLGEVPSNHRIWVDEGSTASRVEPYRASSLAVVPPTSQLRTGEVLPNSFATWLLVPVLAPDFSLRDVTGKAHNIVEARRVPLLLNFWVTETETCRDNLKALDESYSNWKSGGLELITVNLDSRSATEEKLATFLRDAKVRCPVLLGTDDFGGVYNILYRYIFDRHRDLTLPVSFLLNTQSEIVRIYQGRIDPRQVDKDFRQIPLSNAKRLARALPFPGTVESSDFRRNYLSYGSIFFQRGYMDQAASAFRKALDDNPSSAEALYGLGSVQLKEGNNAEARTTFARATQAKAGYPDTIPNSWNNLGLLAGRENKIDDAVQYFQTALQVNPNHSVALGNLGNAYRQQKKWSEALQVLQRAVSLSPQDPEANYSLGMVYAQLDDNEQAYNYLRKALELRPVYPEALNNLGVLYLRTQKIDAAVATFEKCIDLAPGFDQAYLNLARVYVLEKNPEKARTVLLSLLKQHPDHAAAQRALSELQ